MIWCSAGWLVPFNTLISKCSCRTHLPISVLLHLPLSPSSISLNLCLPLQLFAYAPLQLKICRIASPFVFRIVSKNVELYFILFPIAHSVHPFYIFHSFPYPHLISSIITFFLFPSSLFTFHVRTT